MLSNTVKISFLYIMIILSAISFSVNGAPDNSTDNKDSDNTNKESVVKPAGEKEKEYIYDPTGKTDPFRSFITVQQEKMKKEDERPKTELETFELSQLTLSAIIVSEKGKWALVKDSKDVAHVIEEGTPIGTNGGFVYKIKNDEVIIREEFLNFRGEKQTKDIAKKSPSAD